MSDHPLFATVDPGSFRDPAGAVFCWQGRIFRAVNSQAADYLTQALKAELLQRWGTTSRIVSTETVDASHFPPSVIDSLPFVPTLIVEHAGIPYISYPYEWPFSLLKLAALHHLDLQIEALEAGLVFTDASAYNIQFMGVHPIFIDPLSLRPYQQGEYWKGYRQFCEQFLNPLLLTASLGVPYGPWYRGTLEGISVEALAKLLPKSEALSWTPLVHVFLHAYFIRRAMLQRSNALAEKTLSSQTLSKAAYKGMLNGIRSYISTLRPKGFQNTFWGNYERSNSYSSREIEVKTQFVCDYIRERSPTMVYDIGCNSGYFSEQALQSGAKRVIGFDFDQGALEAAISRANERKLDFLPLSLDIANPSPCQGWKQTERRGFQGRANPDGLLALAVLHHMVIGRNIPLTQAISWLTAIAPTGVIEFIPKKDPMVTAMLSRREDVFPNYNIDDFRNELKQRATITREQPVSATGRTVFLFDKTI